MPSTHLAHSIERRFSAAATSYEQESQVHEQVAEGVLRECRAKNPQSVLDIGTGTGMLTRRLAARFPEAHLTALDISDAMLDTQPRSNRVERIPCDYWKYTPKQPFDFIASSSALHWMPPLPSLLEKIDQDPAPGGLFSAAVMTSNTFSRLREAQAHVLGQSAMPALLPNALDWQEALLLSPFELQSLRVERIPVIFSNAKRFLQHLNQTGVTGRRANRQPMTRRQLRELVAYYDEQFNVDGGVIAEYETLTIHCSKR